MLRNQANALCYVSQISGGICSEARDIVCAAHRPFNYRAFPCRKMKWQAHDFERQQQVCKNDGGIHLQNFGGGYGDFRCKLRNLARYSGM